MNQTKTDKIKEELEAIAEGNRGILRGIDVIRFAQENQDSTLNSRFQWDDSKAGHQYRLQQARQLIRLHVTVVSDDSPEVKVWVSLSGDRVQEDGGYRRVESVMSNDLQRAALVREALKDANVWRTKWKDLEELRAIFAAIQEAS
jgi:hypothetical protein